MHQTTPTPDSSPIHVAAFYHFVHLPDYQEIRISLIQFGKTHNLKGMILLAEEGINGTISGSKDDVAAFQQWLVNDPRFDNCHYKTSLYHRHPFFRLKVRLKKEIVTMGKDTFSIDTPRGTYVDPDSWNALISRPEVRLIDTRNAYEVKIGTFKNAINPETSSFRDFPDFALKALSSDKKSPIALMCTGGIRCEKASQYLKSQGFEEVYHLKGGILKYLEEIPESKSLWEGTCFVFDQRVGVTHGLIPTSETLCFGCRRPLLAEEKNDPLFEEGVSCASCYESTTKDQKNSFRQRHLQIQLGVAQGLAHMGPMPASS